MTKEDVEDASGEGEQIDLFHSLNIILFAFKNLPFKPCFLF